MRVLVGLLVLVGCTSTRRLANPADVQLQTGDRSHGFALRTTDVWRARLDPLSTVRVGTRDGGWSDPLDAEDLHADPNGVWLVADVRIAHFADALELVGAPEALREPIERTRPEDATFEQDRDRWVLRGPVEVMRPWLIALRRAIRPKGPPFGDIVTCDGDDCAVYRGEAADAYRQSFDKYLASVPSIRFHTSEQGWHSPLYKFQLGEALLHTASNRLGWQWRDIARVEVQSFSGGKTLGAMFATAALAIALAPVALVMHGVPFGRQNGGGSSGSGGGASRLLSGGGGGDGFPPGNWEPALAPAESVHAPALFSTGARVRSWIRPTLTLDGSAAIRGDVTGAGLLARVRLGNVFEIGGGAREVVAKRGESWERSTTPVFAMGLHLPIDANERIAIPLGFEISGSNSIAHDIRIPWGVRLQSGDGKRFVTVSPGTPQYLRLTGERAGRWSLAAGAEVGVAF